MPYLQIPQLREGVEDDTEDDVHTDGGDDDEEGDVIHRQDGKVGECILRGVEFNLEKKAKYITSLL